jgi:hypothetical protein
MKPFYTHDCDKCQFVGNIWRNNSYSNTKLESDLYISCSRDSNGRMPKGYIIRCGDDGPDYITSAAEDLYRYL